jgi:putative oxidoreductase
MTNADIAALLLRAALGVILIAHGRNHGWGEGGLAGTAGWFESIGLRPARLHAAVSAYMEVAAGAALLLGLLVPFAAAAGVGVMTVAFVTVHRANGFFIFGEGEGYEYVGLVAFSLVALSVLGSGKVSIDRALGFTPDGGWVGLAVAAAGVGGAGLMLATSWRPQRS